MSSRRAPFLSAALYQIALLLIIFLSCAPGALARAKAKNGAPKYITIPIYFLTDREKKGESFGNRRRYPVNCKHHMYYGTASITVPNTEGKLIDDKLKALGWKAAERQGPKVSPKDILDPDHPFKSRMAFLDRLAQALKDEKGASSSSAPPDLCLFVHGAADAFEYCEDDAAELAYNLEKPLVLYSWPSDPHLRGYFIDGTNIEWTQKHFQIFCHDLLDLKANTPMNVICLSHSMGNRLVIRSLPVMYGKDLISDWEVISPDIDADTCRHYMMGFSQPKAKIRLYVSNKDLILPFTQMLNGGYYRLGEAADPVYENKKRNRAEYLERIDFTAIDRGWYGHSLPFELVAHMVLTDRPPDGYHLVPETAVKGNRLARFASRSERLASTSSEADFCSRLVKNTSKDTKALKSDEKLETSSN